MLYKLCLALILTLAACAPYQLINTTITSMNITEAQIIFTKQFCSSCKVNQKYCKANMDFLSKLPQAGYFNVTSIENNPFNVTKINILIIQTNETYKYPNGNIVNKSHWSILYVPAGSGVKLRGLALYYHPTIFGKWNGPTSNGEEYQALAALYASRGLALLIPNLLGFMNDKDPHPYVLQPQLSIRSGVSTLNKITGIFRTFGKNSVYLYVVGYSQGGAYAAWFSKCIQFPTLCPLYTLSNSNQSLSLDKFYKLKGSVTLEGALQLEGIMYPFLKQYVGTTLNSNRYMVQYQFLLNIAKGPLLINVLNSYLPYQLNVSNKLQDYVSSGFFKMNCDAPIPQQFCNLGDNHYNISYALMTNFSEAVIGRSIGYSSFAKTINQQPQYLGAKQFEYELGDKNSILSLASKEVVDDPKFKMALRAASITDYASFASSPVYAWTLNKDSIVTSNNTRRFQQYGYNNKFVSFYQFDNSKYGVCDGQLFLPVDHLRGQILGNIFAINFIQQNM